MDKATTAARASDPNSTRADSRRHHLSQEVAFLDRILALLADELGAVKARTCFGGFGLYHRGMMFGLVSDGVLYLKAAETAMRNRETRRTTPFASEEWGPSFALSCFWSVPETELHDPSEVGQLARKAYIAASALNS